MVEVILVEESVSESAIACIAIALRRPGTRVREVRNLHEATVLLHDQAAVNPLVILGPRSLTQPLEPFMDVIGQRAAVVGLASGLAPLEWKDYAATVKCVLEGWIASPGLEHG